MLISIAGHANKGGCSGKEAVLLWAGWYLVLRAPGGRWGLEAQREHGLNAVRAYWHGGAWQNAAEDQRQYINDWRYQYNEEYMAER